MPILEDAHLDFAQAEKELDEFKQWLDSNADFIEKDGVAEIKSRKNLTLLIGQATGKGRPDCFKHEFTIQGVFRADLVVGCKTTKHFVLIEFEGGGKSSVFNQRKGTAQLRDWGSQLQHGFSQVSDWSWAKNDSQKSDIYRNAFGMTHMSETYVIVCGRDAHLSDIDRSRLFWRSEKTEISACKIWFWTYDDLYTECSAALDVYRDIKAEMASSLTVRPAVNSP